MKKLLTGILLMAVLIAARSVFTAHAAKQPPVIPQISPVFTPQVQRWNPLIQAWSIAYGLNANLIATVMQIESCGDPQIGSSAGAQGLFQVMPFHFQGDENPLDPVTNGKRAMLYLAHVYHRTGGDIGLTLAAYNGGESVLYKDVSRWANETVRYVTWGSTIYQDSLSGKPSSQMLRKWLDAGGSSLCKRAARDLS